MDVELQFIGVDMRGLTFRSTGTAVAAVIIPLLVPAIVSADAGDARWFPDRPVAWFEHDDTNVATTPSASELAEMDQTMVVRDSLANEVDRALALEGRRAALDVNAADEVPCSTWFCARNHLRPMTPDEVVAGPPAIAPVLPLRIVKGKDTGAAAGFQVVDSAGRKFMLKLDPAPWLGLASAGEIIGARIFYAAGYHTPTAFLLALGPRDLVLDPKATFYLHDVQKRPLTQDRIDRSLALAARNADGTLRAAAVPWIAGKVLGAFDFLGQRADDPNDRIPHQDRRSLRADWVLYSWLSVFDASSFNTLDSYVEEGGRRFIRHYHFDYGCSFGSATMHPQSPREDGERTIEVGRTLRALFSLGFYKRDFQYERAAWAKMTKEYPSVGYYPAETFDPEKHRTNRKVPAHMRRTDRDDYWGAKVVTSFTDAQLDALVAAARLPAADGDYLAHALKVRRDIIGRRYLRPLAAVEQPRVSEDGAQVCFDDLAIGRGYATAAETRYGFEISDGHGNRVAAGEQAATGARACVPVGGVGRGTGYRVVQIVAQHRAPDGAGGVTSTKATRVHLRWRDAELRFVVVGLERDE
jgi:hypothetical protein